MRKLRIEVDLDGADAGDETLFRDRGVRVIGHVLHQ